MSYTSFVFFAFAAVSAAVYFVVPKKLRWIVLLAASIYFYGTHGWRLLPLAAAAAVISYAAGRMLSAKTGKAVGKRRLVLVLTLLVLIGFLGLTKAAKLFAAGNGINLWIPLGVSYYTFSSVGYVLDIYWGRYAPERNILKFLLYILYFPHIVQGPIPRYEKLSEQLYTGHAFDYRRVTFGVQLVIWGLFQKLVIADRIGTFVTSAYDRVATSSGKILLFSTFLYAIQIYTDFSGCVDIARGISQVFGITLEENFRRPYFSRSIEEFWRRWHITLGAWFRDYLAMPVSVSKPIKRFSKKMRKAYGAEAGKNAVTIPALIAVWTCTGIWHGTGWNYVLWAVWQGGIIALGTLLRRQYASMKAVLRIKEDSIPWMGFQMLRTFILAGMIPRVLTRANSLRDAGQIFRKILTMAPATAAESSGVLAFGLDGKNLTVLGLSLIVLLAVSLLRERGVPLRQKIAAAPFPARWLVYLAAFYAVLIFGVYGPGYDPSAFIYAGF